MGSAPPLRVVASMTIDPDGAMHDWIDLPEGWALTAAIPTQEIIHLVGLDGYQSLLLDVVERERPAILLTHPPYDYVTEATARAIQSYGTKLVGYAFDDDIFAMQQTTARTFAEKIYDRYVTTRQVRWATRPIPALPEVEPVYDVALVGRAYPRRQVLVESLRSRGFDVEVRGLGWPEGWANREGMLDLYAKSRIVLTTADWEDCDVRMVKHRVLDTALLGRFQMVEHSPDLAAYFAEDEVVAYRDIDELCTLLGAWIPEGWKCKQYAARARARCINQHCWTLRWPQLIDGLTLQPTAATGHSLLLDQSYAVLAARAEQEQRFPAALALWSTLVERQPESSTAYAGIGRCLLASGKPADAIAPLLRSLAAPHVTASYLSAQVSSQGLGAAMGQHGLWPPTAESAALLVAAYEESGDDRAAVWMLESLTDPALRRRLGTVLQVPDAGPSLRAALDRLK